MPTRQLSILQINHLHGYVEPHPEVFRGRGGNLVRRGNPKRIRGFRDLLKPVVKMDEPFRVYRDAGGVLTRKGKATPLAREFTDFFLSPAGSRIFAKWGWDPR